MILVGLGLNFFQALFTQLQDDEAYYWVYSKFLDWGYYDHPPMIALLVKIGNTLLPGEIGVRLLPVILNVLTLLIVEKLIVKKNTVLFYSICLSMALLQLTGFWAVPDIPLMFFTALFFLCYKKFRERPTWGNTIFLAVATTCLFYSKYHGVLVVLFTIAADVKVLRNYRAYIAGLIVFLLFFPHLWWQYQHDWMSFRFQLFEKKTEPYTIARTTDYLVNQIIVMGPISGIIMLVGTFARRPIDKMEKILKTSAVGILIFFLVSSLWGRVEANWTSPALIPIIVLTHNFLQQHTQWRKWLYRLLPVTISVVLFLRIAMVWNILPMHEVVERFHSWKYWPQQLQAKTGQSPKVFNNSYPRASMLWFYTGNVTHSLNVFTERRNNFDFWPIEDSLLGKTVYQLDIYHVDTFQTSLQATMWHLGYSKINNYHSFARVNIQTDRSSYTVLQAAQVTMNINAIIPEKHKRYLQQNPGVDEEVRIAIYKMFNLQDTITCPFTLRALLSEPVQNFSFSTGLEKGEYHLEFIIGALRGIYTHNSFRIKLTVL